MGYCLSAKSVTANLARLPFWERRLLGPVHGICSTTALAVLSSSSFRDKDKRISTDRVLPADEAARFRRGSESDARLRY